MATSESPRTAMAEHGFAVIPDVLGPAELAQAGHTLVQPTLAAHAVKLDDPGSWHTAPVHKAPYANREGCQLDTAPAAQAAVNQAVRAAAGPILPSAEADCKHSLHLRYPRGGDWSPPWLGWHFERGCGNGLQAVGLLHLSTVEPDGGCLCVVEGSHRLGWLLHMLGLDGRGWVYNLLFILAHLVAVIGLCRIRQIPAKAGELVMMHPWTVHSASR